MNGFRFMLDSTAVLAYNGSPAAIHVGELIAEANDEHVAVGVPTLCLIEAMRVMQEPEQRLHVQVLFDNPNVALVPLSLPTVDHCQVFADLVDDLGSRLDLAATAMAAADLAFAEGEPGSVYVLTAVPELYHDTVPVVDIGDNLN
jgi:hypothetical protein